MLKKLITILIVSFSIIAFSNLSWASVLGSWYIQGNVTIKASAKGQKSKTMKSSLDEVWTFKSNGDFETENIGGVWSQRGKKITVNLDIEDTINYFEEILSEELETDISVEQVTKMSCTGTEQKNGTIKGSFKIYMNIYSLEKNIHGKATVSGSFKGNLLQAPAVDVSGYWKIYHTQKGSSETGPDYMSLSQAGNIVSGTFISGTGDNIGEEFYVSGTISGANISLTVYMDEEIHITGSGDDNAMNGTYKVQQGQSGTWRAERTDNVETRDFTIPRATIDIDGSIADWALIEPAYVDEVNDEDPEANFVGTDLKGVYLAQDDDFLYIMFSLNDGNPNEEAQYTFEAVPNAGKSGVEGDYLAVAIFSNGAWSSSVHVRDNPQLNVHYSADYVGVGNGFIEWKVKLSDFHFFNDRYIFAYIHNYIPIFYPVSDSAKTGVRLHLD